jgi:chaperonin GroES
LADGLDIDATLKGNVLSAGKDVKEVRGGQDVVFPKECGVTVKDDGKEYLVLREDNVLAIIG